MTFRRWDPWLGPDCRSSSPSTACGSGPGCPWGPRSCPSSWVRFQTAQRRPSGPWRTASPVLLSGGRWTEICRMWTAPSRSRDSWSTGYRTWGVSRGPGRTGCWGRSWGPWGRRCQCSWRGVRVHKAPGIGDPRVGRSGRQCWSNELGRLCAHLRKFTTTIQTTNYSVTLNLAEGFTPNTEQHQDSIWVWVRSNSYWDRHTEPNLTHNTKPTLFNSKYNNLLQLKTIKSVTIKSAQEMVGKDTITPLLIIYHWVLYSTWHTTLYTLHSWRTPCMDYCLQYNLIRSCCNDFISTMM